ncbi:MAG: M14 family zinc carboxypeptidase, partial [Anaerolineae bacterium]
GVSDGAAAAVVTTPEIAMRMLDWLVDGYGTNADATWLVDYHEIWIVPTVNPDGHRLVELGAESGGSPYYQRKNANQTNGCTVWPPTMSTQYGVDLNRNHSFKWGGAGTSTSPCSQTFRGFSAASEPEVAAVQVLIRSLISDQRGPGDNDAAPANTQGVFITLHSYSELILWPWGYTNTTAPNKAGLQAIGDKMATYNGYTSCQPGSCLYAASGTSDDWAYGELGIPSFTFELGSSFMPFYQTIDGEQWPDNGPALQYAAKIARRPYQLAFGPDILNIQTSITSTQPITLTATLDDRNNGNRALQTAVYTIDAPPWRSNVITHTLSAVDAAFDSPTEEVTAVLPPLPPGKHTLYLQGQDADGNWGAVSAAFVEIPFTDWLYLPLIGKN